MLGQKSALYDKEDDELVILIQKKKKEEKKKKVKFYPIVKIINIESFKKYFV
jgi:hypothetical protein